MRNGSSSATVEPMPTRSSRSRLALPPTDVEPTVAPAAPGRARDLLRRARVGALAVTAVLPLVAFAGAARADSPVPRQAPSAPAAAAAGRAGERSLPREGATGPLLRLPALPALGPAHRGA